MQTDFMKRAAFGAVGAAAVLLAGAAQAAGVPGQGTWETTLLGRDIDGNAVAADSASAVFLYDKTLHVTWLRDGNVNGSMKWRNANNWANGLTVGAYSNWRLPTMIDTGAPGCDFGYSGTDCGYNVQTKSGGTTYSEMAHLFYETLGNKGQCDTAGSCALAGFGLTNTASFQNMQSWGHWSGLNYAPVPGAAWGFYPGGGYQNGYGKEHRFYALAVRPGDVAAVPEPQTYAMLLLGLTGLAVVARRRQLNSRQP